MDKDNFVAVFNLLESSDSSSSSTSSEDLPFVSKAEFVERPKVENYVEVVRKYSDLEV